MALLPFVGQPVSKVAARRPGQICQQLGEIELRVDVVAATSAGDAGQDGGSSSAARIANEQAVLTTLEIFP